MFLQEGRCSVGEGTGAGAGADEFIHIHFAVRLIAEGICNGYL